MQLSMFSTRALFDKCFVAIKNRCIYKLLILSKSQPLISVKTMGLHLLSEV